VPDLPLYERLFLFSGFSQEKKGLFVRKPKSRQGSSKGKKPAPCPLQRATKPLLEPVLLSFGSEG